MSRYLRPVFTVFAAVQVLLAIGFIFQVQLIVQFWPLPYNNATTFLLIGSFFAAAAASTFWCLWSKDDGAFAGIALDYLAIFVPMGIYSLQISSGRTPLVLFSLFSFVSAVWGLVLLAWSIRIPIRDSRPIPLFVRRAFVVFIVALVFVGGLLVLKVPNILPWEVNVVGQVIYGWMFFGAAIYFIYALVKPVWYNAAGQLVGFLAYDLVLIVPFLLLLPTTEAQRLPNLILYLIVLVSSGAVAIYYLLIAPQTRLISRTA
ncbi:MAG: hypothetical protein SF123_13160 [Chloroflexota bacterium]|nr:hypothetical protein [Chloroflexota bacterium]